MQNRFVITAWSDTVSLVCVECRDPDDLKPYVLRAEKLTVPDILAAIRRHNDKHHAG